MRDNRAASRFELDVDGDLVVADYRRQGSTLFIDWVEAPPQLRGSGAAGRLMAAIVAQARADGLGIVPICGYAAGWLRVNAPASLGTSVIPKNGGSAGD